MAQQKGATRMYRTHNALGTVSAVGTTVTLSGWVQRRRDLGSIIFIDLRDRSGIVQLVFDKEKGTPAEVLAVAEQLRNEYVVNVHGRVEARGEHAVNAKIATGTIEIAVDDVELLNAAKNPPFYIQDGVDVDEMVRLKHRYLDLRRPEMQKMLMIRHQVMRAFRNYLDDNGFVDVETPVLTKSTPEGARDYLVPSRVQPGEFYALPQSPQLFKQLLMVAGIERYYQVARCFRDEDLRSDRQPEFTQLDIEQSFLSLDAFQEMMEEMVAGVFAQVLQVDVPRPFQRMTYRDAMETYGSDKPDIRFDMPLMDIGATVADMEFRVFQDALAAGGVVKALVLPGCGGYSRKQLDALTQAVAPYGLKGLASLVRQGEGQDLKCSFAKFATAEQRAAIVTATAAQVGDLVVIAAAPRTMVNQALGALRSKLGTELGLIEGKPFKFLWITQFPLLGYDEGEGRYVAEHHPFTMPAWEDMALLDSNPGSVRAQAYDLVLNGFEVGGGSMRIYRRDIQEKMFSILGFTKEQAYEQFGFLLDAFDYGTPPHGGIAFGVDRMVMIMGGGKSLRDCIAFPKTSSGTDLMMVAPSGVSIQQLDTLHLAIKTPSRV